MFSSFSFLDLLSGLAFFVVYVLLAAVCVRSKLRALLAHAPRQDPGLPESEKPAQGNRLTISLATCAALFAFLGIPHGSLPAVFSFKWGGLMVLGCLTLALAFGGGLNWDGATRRKAHVVALLGLALALFAWYAQQQGAPGDMLSLGSYVAVPLADIARWQEKIGMLLLALAFLLAARDVQQDLASGLMSAARLEADKARAVVVSALMQQIWILAALAMAVCLFVPSCPAEWFGMSGVTSIVVNTLVFWLKILLADHALWLVSNTLSQARAWLAWTQFLLAGLGALCLFAGGGSI